MSVMSVMFEIKRILGKRSPKSSFAQQRLWFVDQYEPGTGLYNIPVVWQVQGKLDVAALERSINEVVRRHEILRTSFAFEDGSPVQIIAKHLQVKLQVTDLSGQEDAHRQVERLTQEEAERAFDLSRGPLIRAGVLKLGEAEHMVLLTLHHVISDGWSMGVLIRELNALYRAFIIGHSSPLKELPIQYGDFAVWQREWLQGEVLQQHLNYWRQTLEGAPPVLELPTDRPRPAMPSHCGAELAFDLGLELSDKLHQLSRKSGSTLFMMVAAVFNVLLSRYSRQDDICIGYPVANRNRAEIEELIGFFVNTLVLRTRLMPEQSFESLLKQVRGAVLDADTHQDLPFEKLVEELRPERNLNHFPLFQVMFAWNNTDSLSLELPGLKIDWLQKSSGTAKFDLTLHMTQSGQHLRGWFEYNSDLFNRETIERMVEHLRVLLEAVVNNPQAKLRELPLLTPAEEHKLLVEWNDTKVDYSHDKCIHQLFEEQVTRNPDAVAVVFENQQLTYAELNAKANQLAHYLRELGVKPDTLVAICAERSIEMIVGMLGILKAGGAYVPLDPAYPRERLAFMLQDSGAVLVLTQGEGRPALAGMAEEVYRIDIKVDKRNWARFSKSNPRQTEGGDGKQLAYVIYTSGSTGRPKGIAIHQRGVVNLVEWYLSQFGLNASDKVLLFSSFSFDLTQKNILSVLFVGGQLHMLSDGYDPERAYSYIQSNEVTFLNCAPSAFYPRV